MKAAKFLICCLLTVLIIFPPFRVQQHGITAAAATSARYARADSKDVYFYERRDLDYALFTIPYTYCVEILSADGDWYYVKYAEDNPPYRALYGYCRTDNLTPVDEPPENIYLNWQVTLTFKTETPVGSLPVSNELSVNAAYYGAYYSGTSAYSYVLYDKNFYYVYGANDGYPLNEIPQPEPEQPAFSEQEGGVSSTVITALALTGVAAAALIILYFTGRKSKYFRPDN